MSTNPIVQQWEAKSHTEVGKTYTVSKRRNGEYSCSCPRWKFHPAPRPACKHITGLLYDLQPSAPTPQRVPSIPAFVPPIAQEPEEKFTFSVLQPIRRKVRADL